jgi:hypothetical protein
MGCFGRSNRLGRISESIRYQVHGANPRPKVKTHLKTFGVPHPKRVAGQRGVSKGRACAFGHFSFCGFFECGISPSRRIVLAEGERFGGMKHILLAVNVFISSFMQTEGVSTFAKFEPLYQGWKISSGRHSNTPELG